MRIKTTLTLLAIAIIAAAYFFLVEQPQHKRGAEMLAINNRLTAVFPDAVDRIEISRQDINMSFDRHRGHWRIVTPVLDRADDSAVNTLLYSIAQASVERRLDSPSIELEGFGLDPPTAEVTIEGTIDGEPVGVRVIVGNFSLTKSHCYSRVEGTDGVLLAPAGIRRYALRSLFEFRHKRITEVPVDQLCRILVTSPGQSIDWLKNGSQGWFTVQNGDSIPGDSSAVAGIAKQMRALRAKNILSTDRAGADDLFTAPEKSISMWIDNSTSPVVIEFGNRLDGSCHVSSSADKRVALVDTTVLRVFRMTVQDLRDKRLFDFDSMHAAKLTMDTASQPLTLIINDSDWAYANPEFGRVDQTRAQRLAITLRSLKFEDVIEEHLIDPEPYGFDKPYFELTVFDHNDLPIDRIRVGRKLVESPSRYVTSLSTGVVARVEEKLINRLADDLHDLGSE